MPVANLIHRIADLADAGGVERAIGTDARADVVGLLPVKVATEDDVGRPEGVGIGAQDLGLGNTLILDRPCVTALQVDGIHVEIVLTRGADGAELGPHARVGDAAGADNGAGNERDPCGVVDEAGAIAAAVGRGHDRSVRAAEDCHWPLSRWQGRSRYRFQPWPARPPRAQCRRN